ncbi:hypothetical protein HYX16_05560 [Candidatus Woesearchaeota archaeon]|nr:hypothetical protein [Candidatus Woesearchaeota archaeon]
MANDNGLIDQYEELQNKKKELEMKEEKLKNEIIKLSQEKNTSVLFGTHKKCSIKEYVKIIYPENKTIIVNLIREKLLYDKLSSINYFKLGSAIRKNEVGKEISDLTKQEKAFRISLKDIK